MSVTTPAEAAHFCSGGNAYEQGTGNRLAHLDHLCSGGSGGGSSSSGDDAYTLLTKPFQRYLEGWPGNWPPQGDDEPRDVDVDTKNNPVVKRLRDKKKRIEDELRKHIEDKKNLPPYEYTGGVGGVHNYSRYNTSRWEWDEKFNKLNKQLLETTKKLLFITDPNEFKRVVNKQRNDTIKAIAEARDIVNANKRELREDQERVDIIKKEIRDTKQQIRDEEKKARDLKRQAKKYDKYANSIAVAVADKKKHYQDLANKLRKEAEQYTDSADSLKSGYSKFSNINYGKEYGGSVPVLNRSLNSEDGRRESTYYDLKRAEKKMSGLQQELGKINGELDAVDKKLGTWTRRGSNNQSVAGFPPDADLLYRLKRMEWWANTSISHNDAWKSNSSSKNNNISTMIGADMRLGGNSGVGFGVGYSRNDATQGGGVKTDSDSLNLSLRGYWGPTDRVTFDTSIAYSISDSKQKNSTTGVTDDYLVRNVGFGVGVSSFRDLSPLYQIQGRLGWSKSFNTRLASTDSAGTRNAKTNSTFSRASLSGKLKRKLTRAKGSVFLDGKFDLVTEGSSKPLSSEFGGGIETRLKGAAKLTARGYVGSIGLRNQTSYGGSLNLGLNF